MNLMKVCETAYTKVKKDHQFCWNEKLSYEEYKYAKSTVMEGHNRKLSNQEN